jgi:hypothetical protein
MLLVGVLVLSDQKEYFLVTMVVLLQGVLVLFGKLVGCSPFPSQMLQQNPLLVL